MADITTFTSRESVVHAAFQALEKEGINISLPFPKDVSLPDTAESGVFGVPLDSNQMCSAVRYGSRSVTVPKFLADAVEFLEGYLTVEGLFRKAGSLTRQREMKAHVQSGGNLANHHKPHDVACLLKLFLRELPDPLLTNHLAPAFTRTHTFEQSKQRACIMLLCLLLPQTHLNCLQILCQFLHNVSSNSDHNLMDAVNLALVMAPNLLPFIASTAKGGHEQCLEASTSVVKILIEHYEEVGLVPEGVASVAKKLEEEGGWNCRGKSVFVARSCETPDGLVTDGSTGDELDSDGELSAGLVRKKSSKKSRTRMFVHNLGNKLRSRYGNKNTDTKTPNSSPVTKEHIPRILSNMTSHDASGSSSPLVTTKRKADYDPHLMSASKRQAILQNSVATSSKLRSGKLFRTPLTMKATKRSILRRCRHTDYGKTRKNAYLVLQPSYSMESFVDQDPNCEHSASVASSSHLASTCDNTEMPESHKTIPLSKDDDGFPLVEFSMSTSVQKCVDKSSTPVGTDHGNTKGTVENDGHHFAGRLPNVKSKSVPPKPLKTSISADNVKYFSATPEINFVKISDSHEHSNPYKFEAKFTRYPRSISDHQGLKSSYEFGSGGNLLKSSVNSTSACSHTKDLQDEDSSTKTQNTSKFTNDASSLKKSTSQPVICNLTTGAQKNTIGISTHYPNSRSFKSSSLSPSKITGDTSNYTRPKKNSGMQFEFSEPAVVQPAAAYVLEVDTPQQYSDIEKDPESSEIYSTDEVQVSYLESQDVRKQLFTDGEHDHDEVCPPHLGGGGGKDDKLFGNSLKNTEANIPTKCSDLLEEISSDLAEKHRYSPNYVIPLTAVQSTDKYDNNEILDYTGSPRHCVTTTDRVVVNSTKCWQDDFHQSKLDSHGFPPVHCSPDPWAVRKQTQLNTNDRDHVYTVTKQDTSRHIDFTEADSSEPPSLSQVTTITASSTSNDNQSTTSTIASSAAVSFAKYNMGTQMTSVTTSATSSDDYSATLPSSYRHKSTSFSKLAKMNAPYFPSESSFYTLRNNRHTVKNAHIDARPAGTTVSLSTATTLPKLSLAGISKTSTMPKFYKEMVPLSRKALNNSENVRTKIQQFEGITSQKEKVHSYCKSYGLTGIANEVRELENSPQQHCSKVRRSGTWNFHSPAPMKQASVQGGGARKSNVHTHYTFHCPKVKSEVMHRVNDQCSQYHKTIISENTSRKTTGGITGRKRSLPTSQTDSYKISRPLAMVHYNSNDDQVTGSNSLSTTEYKVIPTLSLPEGKENNQPAVDNSQVLSNQDEEGVIRKQENDMSVPPIRTTILREWII